MGKSPINNLLEILDKVQEQVQAEHVFQSRNEALQGELHRLYLHTSLEICKQKLQGAVSRNILGKMQEIKRLFGRVDGIVASGTAAKEQEHVQE